MLSIDIGSKYIKLLHAKSSGQSIRVLTSQRLETPPDSVVNGFVVDFAKVGAALQAAVREHRLGGMQTAVVVTSPDIIIREIKLPKASDRNIRNIVTNEMDVFLRDEQHCIEYFLQEKSNGAIRTFVFALPIATVEGYKKMLTAAGLKPAILDVGANAMRKLVARMNLPVDKSTLTVCVDIGYEFINFNLINNNNLLYSRCIRMALDSGVRDRAALLWDKSEKLPPDDQDLTAYYSYIGDELQKIFHFLASSEYRNFATSVTLCGGGANFKSIAKWLEASLDTPVTLLEDHAHDWLRRANLKEYANALGAQIRL